MAKWQSKAEIAEQAYRKLYREAYPVLEEAMKAYVASYDESQPVEEEMKTLANSYAGLLSRRMAKYCVWPLVRSQFADQKAHWMRMVTESMDTFMKPIRDEQQKKIALAEKTRRELLKSRPVARELLSAKSHTPGEYVMFQKEQRVLLCIDCQYIPGMNDYGTFTGGYSVVFTEPDEDEKKTPEYQRAVETMSVNIHYKETLRQHAKNMSDAGEWN